MTTRLSRFAEIQKHIRVATRKDREASLSTSRLLDKIFDIFDATGLFLVIKEMLKAVHLIFSLVTKNWM